MLEMEGQKEHHLKEGSAVDLLQEKSPNKFDLLPSVWLNSSRTREKTPLSTPKHLPQAAIPPDY